MVLLNFAWFSVIVVELSERCFFMMGVNFKHFLCFALVDSLNVIKMEYCLNYNELCCVQLNDCWLIITTFFLEALFVYCRCCRCRCRLVVVVVVFSFFFSIVLDLTWIFFYDGWALNWVVLSKYAHSWTLTNSLSWLLWKSFGCTFKRNSSSTTFFILLPLETL